MFLRYVAANDISGKRVRISMVLRHVMKRVAISCCGRPPEEGENATRGELQRHRRQRVVLQKAAGEGRVGGEGWSRRPSPGNGRDGARRRAPSGGRVPCTAGGPSGPAIRRGAGRRAARGCAAAGAGTPRSPGSLHAAPALAAHFVERIADLQERAAFDGIDQNREAVAILDH